MPSPIFRLYIDETGNADLEASRDPHHRYLSLTGVIVRLDHVRDHLIPGMAELKREILKHDPDEPPILHRKEIMQKTKPWNVLRDPEIEARFNTQLLNLMQTTQFVVITTVIDKLEHLNRYSVWRHDPYHYCLEVLVERYALWLRHRNSRGDVMGEVRGGSPDRRLERCFTRFYTRGTTYIRANILQAHLTSKNLKLRPKSANVAGLQLADLIAHPSALYIRRQQNTRNVRPRGFGTLVSALLLQTKYNRSREGKIEGWGTKWLP